MKRPLKIVKQLLKYVWPALATLALGAALSVTIFYTAFDWQWVAFLSGVLFMAILALASRAATREWQIARRTLQLSQVRERLAQEIEKRKHAEEALKAAEAEIQLITDALPVMICYIDAEQRYRYHNKAFENWINLKPAQIEGRHIVEVLGARAYETVKQRVEQALSGQQARYERDHVSANGAIFRLAENYIPHFGEQGKVLGFYALSTDITERKHLEIGPPEEPESVALPPEPEGDPRERFLEALAHNQFRLYCQAIVPVIPGGNGPDYYEILVRLQEEEENLLPPGSFIPVAERYNLMSSLDRWVVQHLIEWYCENATKPEWRPCTFSINLSGESVSDPGFLDFLRSALQSKPIAPEALCFETTETVAIRNITHANHFGAGLKRLGCLFALDDFGTDSNSFPHLKKLPVDFLKIDGGIVMDIDRNARHFAMVKAIHHFAHAAGIRTIAEFVENEAILEKLREAGVDYAQGFGVARPRPLDELR